MHALVLSPTELATMIFGRRRKSRPPPLLLALLLAVVTLQAGPASAETRVFRLWAADHRVTAPALAELPGGSQLLCAVRCRLQAGCQALQSSADQCRLLADWPPPRQLAELENSTVMVQLDLTTTIAPAGCAEDLSQGGCLTPEWERVGAVCYQGASRTADYALITQEMDFCASLHPDATLATVDGPQEIAYLKAKTAQADAGGGPFLDLRRGPDFEYEMAGRCMGFWRSLWSDGEPRDDDVYAYYNTEYMELRGHRVGQYRWRDFTLCQMSPDLD